MNSIVGEMLATYKTQTLDDKKNALKEIIQEIVLCGLSRAGFFTKGAFYGGTALRIFYGLDRFSEDLDFSLKTQNENFDLTSFFPMLQNEIEAYGLHLKIEEKIKTADSHIKSAFLKSNTKEHLLLFYCEDALIDGIHPSELIKVKFEVDILPPDAATFETRFSLRPAPYEVCLYDLSSLFAGKIHAILCRSWKNRVKGRDLYDYIFFLQKQATVNIEHLKQRLIQTDAWNADDELTIEDVRNMLIEKFDAIDYTNAKLDVTDFIRDQKSLNLWSAEFFKAITKDLK